ncbi:MAG: LysR family transcriptional regulator [Parvularculaceae bacterium]
MDIAAARTFLAIVDAGNFVSASRRLHVTQSTVSARIRALEEVFGKPLFIRTKAACELTPAGRRFYRHARTIVREWEEARHQLAVPPDYDDHLAIGGQYSLWSHYLLDWLARIEDVAPKCSVHASIGMPDRLMQQLVDGVLDLAVMYDPQYRPGLVVEQIFDDTLVLVSAGDDDATAAALAGVRRLGRGVQEMARRAVRRLGHAGADAGAGLGRDRLSY